MSSTTSSWRILTQRDGRVWVIWDEMGTSSEIGTVERVAEGWLSRCGPCHEFTWTRPTKRAAVAALVAHWPINDEDAEEEPDIDVSESTAPIPSIAQSPTDEPKEANK